MPENIKSIWGGEEGRDKGQKCRQIAEHNLIFPPKNIILKNI